MDQVQTTLGAAAIGALASIAMATLFGLSGCATMPAGRDRIVKAAPHCVDQTVQIYFESESAEVIGI